MAQSGFTPISQYYSTTAAAVPTAGNLVNGELALNITDGKIFYKDNAGVVQVIGTKGGVGSSTTTQVLYNSSGLVVGSANLTFNGTTLTIANDASISGLTVGKGAQAGATCTVFGVSALASNTIGDSGDTAIGYQALNAKTTGYVNVAVGSQALKLNTSGYQNTALGYQSLAANLSGANNVAVGHQALNVNTASSNTGVGYFALGLNTSGTSNVALGYSALNSNTTASNNTAVGYQAGYSQTTAASNSILGYQAGYSCTTTGGQVFVGWKAGYASNGGYFNTFVGYNSGSGTTTGGNNTALGTDALQANTTASNNTAVGYQAGYSNSTGANNVTFGWQAGFKVTTGNGNTLIGTQAGHEMTTGIQNTFIGGAWNTNGAGYYVTTGSKNTIIGGYDGNQSGLDIRTASNYIVLSDGDGNPNLYLDNNKDIFVPKVYVSTTASAANMFVTSGGQFVRSTSALKYKQDIRDLEFIDINKFRPVRYKSKSEGDDQTLDHFGIIADEVDQAGIKELVSYGAEGEVEGFQYERLTVVLLKTIQDLQKRIATLEAK